MDPIRESFSENRTSELIAAEQEHETNEALNFCNLLQCQSILQYGKHMSIKQTHSFLVNKSEADSFVIINSSLKSKIKKNTKETSMKKKHNKFEKPQTQEKDQLPNENVNFNQSQMEISTKLLLQSMKGSPIDILDSARSQRRSSDTNNKSLSRNKKVEKKDKKRKFEKVSNVSHNKSIGKDWKTTEEIKDSRRSSCRSFSPMEEFRGSEEVQVVKHRENFLVRIPKFNDRIERNEKNRIMKGNEREIHEAEQFKPKEAISERSSSQITENKKVEPDFDRIYVKSIGNKYMEAILQNCKGIISSSN